MPADTTPVSSADTAPAGAVADQPSPEQDTAAAAVQSTATVTESGA